MPKNMMKIMFWKSVVFEDKQSLVFENWFLVGCLKMIENRAVGTNGDIHGANIFEMNKNM